MTPEAQRIAIAEACGWSEIHQYDNPLKPGVSEWLVGHPPGKDGRPSSGTSRNDIYLPDYLNDLNAMHKAEKVLVKIGWTEHGMYFDRLRQMCGYEDRMAIMATAAQRAEAFLRTLGKWEERVC